mmetsp:Transcript_59162/g.86593  ORF Transcript_59162/g.86593 Transcript_59162/m.86593 type:complete len:215 (+) Transcript_59162:66-710(+)
MKTSSSVTLLLLVILSVLWVLSSDAFSLQYIRSCSIHWPAPTTGGSQLRPSAFRQQSGFWLRRSTIAYGLKVTIHIRGKASGGEKWISEGYDEYERRLKSSIELSTKWYKSDQELISGIKKESGSLVCLDENGKGFSSREFSDLVYQNLEEGGSRLSFVIGGAEGLPQELKAGAKGNLLSLSKMTFTHQQARLLLAEQIYRASEIRKGTGYHKD